MIDRDGRRVVLVTWAQMLAHVKTALEAAGDRHGLDDLAQLRGLCDRADAEAMLPISSEEIGSDRGHRVYGFCDLVDRVTDLLVADGTVDTKGLKATAAKGWYGRYVRSRDGHVASWVGPCPKCVIPPALAVSSRRSHATPDLLEPEWRVGPRR